MGHITVTGVRAYICGGQNTAGADYALGMYVDKDAQTIATANTPYSFGYLNTWMFHKTGTVTAPGIVQCSDGTTTGVTYYTYGDVDSAYRRYDLNLRKYRRRLDSYGDTLVFAIENAFFSNLDINVTAYFRMLLLE